MSAVRQFNNSDDANFNADGKLRIALAGNPNCGKTTVFNGYTGARQHVGNYPGVTVEKKSAVFTRGKTRIELVDLPGVYSLLAASPEEQAEDQIRMRPRRAARSWISRGSTSPRRWSKWWRSRKKAVWLVVTALISSGISSSAA